MKKVLHSAVAFSLVVGCLQGGGVAVIDGNRLLRESREGRNIQAINDKARKDVMELELTHSKRIGKLREEAEEKVRSGKLAPEAIQREYRILAREQRKAKSILEEAREDFEDAAKGRVVRFQEKAMKMAQEYCENKGADVTIPKASTIFVKKSSDYTDGVLKYLDDQYKKNQAKSSISKKVS